MNPEQIDQLLRNQVSQQQQITEILKFLVETRITTPTPLNNNGTELQVTTSTPTEINKIAIINNFRGDKFEPSSNSSIENFIEYFEAKCRIGGESYLNIQKDLLLSCLKPETYHEIKTALIPSFENSTYDDIKNKLLDIYKTRKTRYKALTEFWSCIRDTCESMEHYANRLKELSKDCGYDDTILERQLRDRFATGLNHQQLQIELRQKWPDLIDTQNGIKTEVTFLQLFAIAQSRELAEADINTECNINRISNKTGNRKEENIRKPTRKLRLDQCRRCGKHNRHSFDKCEARNHECTECGVIGHFESCCIKTGRAYLDNYKPFKKSTKFQKNRHLYIITERANITNRVSQTPTSSFSGSEESEEESNTYKIQNKKTSRCKKIDVKINGIKCTMDWDPGSVYSIINTKMWRKIGSPSLMQAPTLKAYCNFKLKPKGLTDITVEVDNRSLILPVIVMKHAEPMLFGLQWSESFDMIFPEPVYSIKNIAMTTNMSLRRVLDAHTRLFDVADYLSRMPNHKEEPTRAELRIHKIDEITQYDKINDLSLTQQHIKEETAKDNSLKQVMQFIKTGWINLVKKAELQPYLRKREELTIENNLVMWQGRIVMPYTLRLPTLKYLHRGHPGKSPAQMMFGRRLTCELDNARPNLKHQLRFKQLQADILNENSKAFRPGDNVYIRDKVMKQWKPGVIKQRTHKYSYKVNTPDGTERRIHADHIRPRAMDRENDTKAEHTPISSTWFEHKAPNRKQSTKKNSSEKSTEPVTPIKASIPNITPTETITIQSTPRPGSLIAETIEQDRLTNESNKDREYKAIQRRSKRTIKPPRRLIEEI
ncbi:unnamed protein product, partial [Brenthis ino]